MKPFTKVVEPHEDIIKGRLTMDVFAADLWRVVNGKAPSDYQNPDLFFKRTYFTDGLKNILQIARDRLEGKSGDSVIQLQTPFGGGKTHTLIALYYKAQEWKAKVVVFDGAAISPKDTKPWEELEKQLTGKIEITKGDIAPGKEKLIELLSNNSPVLILMDEILEYVTKAAGIKVGDSNLAAQTLAFIQELTSAVATVGKALLVITLPSSLLEHYDEIAEKVFQQLQKIAGRVEKVYTPVKDEEIEYIIRARLFSEINEKEVKNIVEDFVEYARKEGLLSNDEITDYKNRFIKSYPFKPEVIDTLYKRWGSLPQFQRTRGVLRLLSLVVHDLLDKNLPFIRLGDFNLENGDIRRELIKYIGNEWDSIIAQDITSVNSGAKKVDISLGKSYEPYKLGTVVSITIFMISFSGKGDRGYSLREIKLSTVYPELYSSTVIDTAINLLREKLFYLSDDELIFTNQPNLNRIIIQRMDNISNNDLYEEEKKLIERRKSSPSKFKIYIHPKFSKDIPDTSEFKLIVLNKTRPDREFIEVYGNSPRVYRNVLLFLCIDENQREAFYDYLRRTLALKSIKEDPRLNLSERQKKEVENKFEDNKKREYEELRKFYRKLILPAKENFKEIDLGVPNHDESMFDKEIYNHLRIQGEILEKLSPKVIKEKYLTKNDYVEIRTLYETLLKTPGELRLISKEAFIDSIKEGVKNGLFGFGYISGEKIEYLCIKETPVVNLEEGEIIIKPELWKKEEVKELVPALSSGVTQEEITERGLTVEETRKKYNKINLVLSVPVGQLSTVVKIANYLNKQFSQCNIEISIDAKEGEIELSEYEDKILEALKQAGINIKKEEKN